MASLADLFNPTFLMFLGILVLVVALLVVYFESKMRDQNHKIASMLSLVSTLAEDMNGVKMGLNHLAIRGGQGLQQQNNSLSNSLGNFPETINNLIEVSDDEDEDNEEENDEEENDEEEDELENEELDIDDEESETNSESSVEETKIIKLQPSNKNVDEEDYELNEEGNNLDFETEDLGDLEGDFEPEVDNEYVEEVLDLKYDTEEKHLEEFNNMPSSSDLKTISINLGDENHQQHEDNIDYKKLQLPKIRSIVIEKGLVTSSEASKLKKPELLKLLGVE